MRGFMEIKGIDVSAWQGKINWKTVADYGMGFAILRITEAGNVADSTFEANYEGCSRYQIPTGVYRYSYAMTPQESVREAEKVVQILNGRELRFPVFLDLEWKNQRVLGSSGVEKIAEAFEKVITAAGYRFGIYCNVDWYQTMISSSLKKYDFWIARYPASDDGWMKESLRPDFGVGWQYSSKARIPGISGYVDRDVFYKDYADENTSDEIKGSEDEDSGEKDGAENLWERTRRLMAEQTGYLEKRSDKDLDSKTANAGYGNYTKYARDVTSWGLPGYQGQPWCAVYQFWICAEIFGRQRALEIMGNGFYNCNSVRSHAKSKGTWHSDPRTGAIVNFRDGAHMGRITRISGNKIYTNEGNTSSGKTDTVEPNGGAVEEKSYTIGNPQIDGYLWIDYKEDNGSEEQNKKERLFVGMVTATELNVRAWAGTEYPRIKSYPVLARGNLVDVMNYTQTASDGSVWYYIRIAGKYYGFVHSQYILRQ